MASLYLSSCDWPDGKACWEGAGDIQQFVRVFSVVIWYSGLVFLKDKAVLKSLVHLLIAFIFQMLKNLFLGNGQRVFLGCVPKQTGT